MVGDPGVCSQSKKKKKKKKNETRMAASVLK